MPATTARQDIGVFFTTTVLNDNFECFCGSSKVKMSGSSGITLLGPGRERGGIGSGPLMQAMVTLRGAAGGEGMPKGQGSAQVRVHREEAG